MVLLEIIDSTPSQAGDSMVPRNNQFCLWMDNWQYNPNKCTPKISEWYFSWLIEWNKTFTVIPKMKGYLLIVLFSAAAIIKTFLKEYQIPDKPCMVYK